LGLLALLVCLAAPLEANQGLFWRVEDSAGRELYLLGSIHLAKPDIYPLSPAITEAFDRSHRLFVEIDVTKLTPEKTLEVFRVGFNPPGIKLADQISPETLDLLTRTPLSAPLAIFQPMRPWMAALTVETLALAKMGYTEKFGLDGYFLGLAHQRSLPIVELETIEEQVDLFATLSPEEGELYLRATLEEQWLEPHPMEQYMDAWKSGDAAAFYAAMEKIYTDRPELTNLLDRVISQRNRSLAQKLEKYFQGEGEVSFVLVGAAHLVGPEGIPTILARLGLRVTQVGGNAAIPVSWSAAQAQ
jgi:uncharacterized protein YbaP (TraB family)